MVLDAGGVDAPPSLQLLQLLTTISPNETEMQRLTGLPTTTEDELLAAAVALQQTTKQAGQQQKQQGGLQVLLKLGTAGSMSVADDGAEGAQGIVRQAAVQAQQVVDTTGVICAAPLLASPWHHHITL